MHPRWYQSTTVAMNKTDLIEQSFLRTDLPEFRPGDTVKVHVRVVEGNRERVQVFQGVVIRRQGGGIRETFTVRKISFGVGVERTFPVHSPSIAKLEVVQRGRVRRAKLYYLRDLRGKKARIKERRIDDAKLAAMERPRPPEPRTAADDEAVDDDAEAADALEAEADTDSLEASEDAAATEATPRPARTPLATDSAADDDAVAEGRGAGRGLVDGRRPAPAPPIRVEPDPQALPGENFLLLVLIALVLAIIIKTLPGPGVLHPVESMVPTLRRGDRILVCRICMHISDIDRGDIIVFSDPHPAPGDDRG